MKKDRPTSDLPSVDDSPALSVVQKEPEREETLAIDLRLIEVPQAELHGEYVSDYIHLRMSAAQAQALTRLFLALNGQHAQLSDGKHVDNRVDAVRWLLEEIAKAGDK